MTLTLEPRESVTLVHPAAPGAGPAPHCITVMSSVGTTPAEPDDAEAVAAKLPHTLGGKLMDGGGAERVDAKLPFAGKGYPQGCRGLTIDAEAPFMPPFEGTANRATDIEKAGAHRTTGVVDVRRLSDELATSRRLRLERMSLLLPL